MPKQNEKYLNIYKNVWNSKEIDFFTFLPRGNMMANKNNTSIFIIYYVYYIIHTTIIHTYSMWIMMYIYYNRKNVHLADFIPHTPFNRIVQILYFDEKCRLPYNPYARTARFILLKIVKRFVVIFFNNSTCHKKFKYSDLFNTKSGPLL